MANLGYALAKGLEGGANAIGILADQKLKEDADARAANRQLANQERLMATQEMMKQRAKEWDQAQAGKRAGEIEADAQGILAGQKVKGVQDMYGDPSLTKDDLLPEELAMIETSDADRARARTTAAEKRGYLTEANEARSAFDSERRFKTDEERTRILDKKNDIAEQEAKSRGERADKLAEKTLAAQKSRDDAIAAREAAATAREERAATSKALDSTVQLIKGKRDEMTYAKSPEEEKAIKAEIAQLEREANGFRKALAGAGIDVPKPASGVSLAAFDPRASAPKTAPAAPAAPAAAPGILADAPAKLTGFGPNVTDEQLFEYANDPNPNTARMAVEALKKRGLIKSSPQTGGSAYVEQ